MATKTTGFRITKLHGLGNDFIVSSDRGFPRRLSDFARAICARHTGIGADGFIALLPPKKKTCDARARIFNADGSEAEMSGNGIRCVGAFLAERAPKKKHFAVETAAGIKTLELVAREAAHEWVFRVAMGKPILEPAKIPFKGEPARAPVVGYALQTERGVLPVTVTSMGNPHCSLFVGNFAAINWNSLGREIENNPLFPRRTNVEFVRVRSRREIEVRFWERGVGETMSSGTGSAAAVVAAVLNGRTGRKVRVRTLAGSMDVEWPEGGEVILTAPVRKIADGIFYFG
jgi:diaminopimelate epimerase